jgi:hypothetical protein
MDHSAERVILVTARVRLDPVFPDVPFISLRRYEIPGNPEPESEAETTTIRAALDLIEGWLTEVMRIS